MIPGGVTVAASPAASPAAPARDLAYYFPLTFGLAWALWALAALATPPDMAPGPRALLFLPGTFAPAIVALAMSVRGPGAGLSGLLAGFYRWSVPVRYWVFALAFMATIKLAAAAAHRLGAGAWPAFGTVPVALLLAAAVLSAPAQAGEELGWRAYALPRLAALVGWRVAGVALGVVWALWHLPMFLIPGADMVGHPLATFVLSVTALSIAMAWLWVRTGGSLILVMLMHAAVNNTTGIVPATPADPPGVLSFGATPMAWLTAALLWVAAAVLLARLPGGRPAVGSPSGP